MMALVVDKIMSSTNGSYYPDDAYLTDSQLRMLAVMELVVGALSCVGASSIVIAIVYKKKTGNPSILSLLSLSLADALSSLFLIICCFGFLFYDDDGAFNDQTCLILTSITMALFMSTLLLTTGYVLDVYLRLYVSSTENSTFQCQKTYLEMTKIVCHAVAWTVPLIISCCLLLPVSFGQDYPDGKIIPWIPIDARDCNLCFIVFHYTQDDCWQFDSAILQLNYGRKYLIVAHVLTVMCTNLVLYVLVIKMVSRAQQTRGVMGYQQRIQRRQVLTRVVLYQTVFILCWTPALIVAVVSLWPGHNSRHVFWLLALQSLSTPLQGLLNAIVYGWKRSRFVNLLRETTPLNGNQSRLYGSVADNL